MVYHNNEKERWPSLLQRILEKRKSAIFHDWKAAYSVARRRAQVPLCYSLVSIKPFYKVRYKLKIKYKTIQKRKRNGDIKKRRKTRRWEGKKKQ
jgi:hypothetical protein